MDPKEEILNLARSFNGIVTSSQVTEAGIARHYLTALSKAQLIYNASRGIYVLPEIWEDELYILQYRYNKGIFSHETALFLLGFSDRAPARYTMTFPYGYHSSSLKGQIIVKKANVGLYELAKTEVASPAGHPLNVYSIERTLCDIVRGNNAVDIQLVQKAMKQYALSKGRNIPHLMEYAGKLRVAPKIRKYMEILL